MAIEGESYDESYTYNILEEDDVSHLKATDGKLDPINLVEYRNDQNDICTPEPLYVPKEELEKLRSLGDPRQKGPHSVMQTFLKMSSVVYSMAGLGSVEETKYFRDKFGSTTSAPDSLREEAERALETPDEEGVKIDTTEADEEVFAAPTKGVLPSATEKKQTIDILLKETDTVWMFVLPGTCKEIEGDEEVQRIIKKEPAKVEKKDSCDGTDDQEAEVKEEKSVDKEDDKSEAKDESKSEATKDESKSESKDKSVEEEEKEKEEEKSVEKEAEAEVESSYVKHRYDLNEKWSQTIDFPRKKKGTQSDPILTHDSFAQVTSKDLLL